ncbi:TonB-dependent receptor [Mesonia sp.]|uniref:TonB-dependent receptor n=1 Tax=Mesonia sp. TaxID=1960830 RepID=UPI003F9CFEE1
MKLLRFLLICFFALQAFKAYNQEYSVKGTIIDSLGTPIEGAHVHTSKIFTLSQADGSFHLSNLLKGAHQIQVSYMGYVTVDTLVKLSKDMTFNFKLKADTSTLGEVFIKTSSVQKTTVSRELVNQEYLQKEFTGSLAKSLEKLPGLNAMEIGAGTSKPIIRGLGLNRVAVAENGIKQEGQQWGADHGLELDGLSIENLEILKGVGAIEYGSDAIGGVIKINNTKKPSEKGLSGHITALGKSVNNTIGSSLNLNYRGDKFFYKLKLTGMEYGDYSLPTDTISYLNFKMPVYDEKLKNTAGKELDMYAQVGYMGEKVESLLSVSNVYQKSGFFPGAHGIPSVDRVRPDGDTRNIGYPYQRVNHFKVINNNKVYFEEDYLEILLGYQENKRQEWSLFHTHYANQQPPVVDPNLELNFELATYDAQAKYTKRFSNQHTTSVGIQAKWQENTIDGFNFLLPQYTSNNFAAFATHEFKYSKKLLYSFGMRYDQNSIDIDRHYDPTLYEYLIDAGQSEEEATAYAERSPQVDKDFGSFNVMAGVRYELTPKWTLNANAGTNFRIPTAIELGANGIHHGSFRHEQGDVNLDPEKGWVADAKLSFKDKSFSWAVNPYAYYFTNYIFLKPTGNFSVLPHSGQLFKYTQSEALLSGVEVEVEKTFFSKLRTLAVAEYLYNKQITSNRSRNYPLPFTPANNLFLETGYTLWQENKTFQAVEVYLNARLAMKQDQIAQGEEVTPGYELFGAGVSGSIHIQNVEARFNLQVTNLFNTKYFNHTSFYRRLEIPEMGRNIQLNLTIPFGNRS